MKKLVLLGLLLVGILALGPIATLAQGPTESPPAPPPRLGVVVSPADSGLRVERVLPGSPAEEAGVLEGDVIAAANGSPVPNPAQLREMVAGGDEVVLTILRGQEKLEISIMAGPQTEAMPEVWPPPDGRYPPYPYPYPYYEEWWDWRLIRPLIEELEGIGPGEFFSHFLGAEVKVTDKDANPRTLRFFPGKVKAVSETTLAITPNGQETSLTFTVTANTVIKKGGEWVRLRRLKAGEQVLVVTVDSTDKASVLLSPGPRFRPVPLPRPIPMPGPMIPERPGLGYGQEGGPGR